MQRFNVNFSDWDGFQTYPDHPDHKPLGSNLVFSAFEGIDEILCINLPVGDCKM